MTDQHRSEEKAPGAALERTVDRTVGRPSSSEAGAASRTEAQFHEARILIVDDEEKNIVLLRRVLETAGYASLAATTDSRQALSRYQDFRPDLILLDLNMPRLDGFGVLEQLAPAIPQGTYLPILVLTGDSTRAAKQRALALGAKDFLTKPFDIHEVLLRIHNLLEPRFMHLALQDQNQLLETRVRERTRALEEAKLEVLERLARAAEFRDDATGQHTRRVARTAALLAEGIGVDRETVDLIARAGPLHDVGKIGIPDLILLKPGTLSPAEFEVMRTHTTIGAQLLSGGSSALMQMAEEIALYHHERWDGTGYPTGLSGDGIPLPARIVAIADVFDALSHPRPYRNAWPGAEVIAHISGQAGRHFDPHLVEAFLLLPQAEPL